MQAPDDVQSILYINSNVTSHGDNEFYTCQVTLTVPEVNFTASSNTSTVLLTGNHA